MLVAYASITASIFTVSHKETGFGRMNAYQAYATAGEFLSLGLVDRTLVDWYMLGPTLETNGDAYDRIITSRILQLAPVFLAWVITIAWGVGRLTRQPAQIGV